jgi:hypothetical protein
MDRRREGNRAAAGERAGPARDPGRVGERDDDIVGCDLPRVGDDLSEDRLHPLALRGRTGRDINLAGGIDPHGRTLERPERPDPGPLDIAADAKPQISALSARLALTFAERRYTADGIERLLQSARIIAASRNAVCFALAGRQGFTTREPPRILRPRSRPRPIGQRFHPSPVHSYPLLRSPAARPLIVRWMPVMTSSSASPAR